MTKIFVNSGVSYPKNTSKENVRAILRGKSFESLADSAPAYYMAISKNLERIPENGKFKMKVKIGKKRALLSVRLLARHIQAWGQDYQEMFISC